MSKTYRTSDLLDRASSPLQTYIILAQLAMLRKLDRTRNEKGYTLVEAVLATSLIVVAIATLLVFLRAAGVNVAPLIALALGQ
jgi:hypothetical protein